MYIHIWGDWRGRRKGKHPENNSLFWLMNWGFDCKAWDISEGNVIQSEAPSQEQGTFLYGLKIVEQCEWHSNKQPQMKTKKPFERISPWGWQQWNEPCTADGPISSFLGLLAGKTKVLCKRPRWEAKRTNQANSRFSRTAVGLEGWGKLTGYHSQIPPLQSGISVTFLQTLSFAPSVGDTHNGTDWHLSV